MNKKRNARIGLLVAAITCAAPLSALAELPPSQVSTPVLDPGRSIASGDDSSAIAKNPADLGFLPAPELRWTWVWTTDDASAPMRGHSVSVGLPLSVFATGLRVDFFDPPSGAPQPFKSPYHFVRWGLSFIPSESFSFGTTLGWGGSNRSALDGHFSLTSGLTWRPVRPLSIALVARDWNRPINDAGFVLQRSYEAGIALRPGGDRAFELGLETALYVNDDTTIFVPKATLGFDIPRIGRMRGDVAVQDIAGDRGLLATVGLDVNLGSLQVSGGGVIAGPNAAGGSGFFAGAALRWYREPGVRFPARVVKVRVDATPGVRRHTALLRRLWRLAADPEVSGVVLVLRAEPASSLAHAEEIGDAIRGLKARGKKVICHLEDAGGRSLFTCSQADRIAMNPAGGLRFAGLSSSYYYLGSLLTKLNVQADFVRIGDHKLAAEQLTRSGGSGVAKVDHQELVDQFESVFMHDVGGGRRIDVEELKRRVRRGPFLASEARAAGLIDQLAYDDEIERVVEEVMGEPARVVDDELPKRAPEAWGAQDKVAIVYLSGDMMDGESQTIPFLGIKVAGSYTIARALRRAREDSTVRAVVFRVGTGGGSSLAADVILREAILTARAKPLIVSMGSSAASGGYYASVAGSKIFANRSTITGSIGIFYGKVDLSSLLAKVGINFEHFRSAPRADAESLYRPFTDEERRELGVKVKQFYDLFIARVAEGRHMSAGDVDAIARGRVWTGAQALERKLVDQIGGLREALEEARKLGGLPESAPIVEMPEEDDSLLGMLLGLAGAQAAAGTQAAGALLPPALLDVARMMSPFLIFDASKPLARSELVEDVSFGGPRAAPEEP